MIRLMFTGLAAGLFFSSTFVLNRAMSLEGGHWYRTASLRYFYMVGLLTLGLLLVRGPGYLRRVLSELAHHWRFWIVSGSIGFGCFYALICFAAGFAPAWVVATTWQLTIIASLVVLRCFGGCFSGRIWLYALVVFTGVSLVNLSNIEPSDLRPLLQGGLPVLLASFCYPLGNQLVWEATHGDMPTVPANWLQLMPPNPAKSFLPSSGKSSFSRPPFPTPTGFLGMLITIAGLLAFVRHKH